jgi:hypothetical protein
MRLCCLISRWDQHRLRRFILLSGVIGDLLEDGWGVGKGMFLSRIAESPPPFVLLTLIPLPISKEF